MMHTVKLWKRRATWMYDVVNPQGGGFGSNYCGPQYIAIDKAVGCLPAGTQYRLIVNGKDQGIRTKGGS